MPLPGSPACSWQGRRPEGLPVRNGLFEPVWDRKHIAYVQIDVPETLAIEGRADFYDHTGAYRDMIVTHLFQVLGSCPCRSAHPGPPASRQDP
jgi:glucose-6-phosphate 1-dehydrogenase